MDRHTIATQMNADLAIGWWIWTSPNKVEHLVEGTGKCATCGRSHKKDRAGWYGPEHAWWHGRNYPLYTHKKD